VSALERLDLHDPDFRPLPGREVVSSASASDGSGLTMEIAYLTGEGFFEVVVTRGGDSRFRRFRAGHAPRFGIDVADRARAVEIADELASEIEKGGTRT
jgi:hypothetical protein